jgi:hypothetical protein
MKKFIGKPVNPILGFQGHEHDRNTVQYVIPILRSARCRNRLPCRHIKFSQQVEDPGDLLAVQRPLIHRLDKERISRFGM